MERYRSVKSNNSVLVAVILLYLSRVSVQCTRNGTKSREEFLENCCFGNVDDTSDRRCDSFDDTNGTWSTIPFEYDTPDNVSSTPCCTVCVSKELELETEIGPQEPRRRNGRNRFEVESRTTASTSTNTSTGINPNGNTSRVCSELCFSRHKNDENFVATRLSKEGTASNGEGKTSTVDRRRCNSVFSPLNYWGANIVVFANAIYIFPYVVVVVIYLVIPGLNVRAFGRIVICYNVTQIVLNLILIVIGVCDLCHVPLHLNVYIIVGLTLMFLTISSTFWLFMICIDVTLAITRFYQESRVESKNRMERTKFLLYAGCTWGGSLLPTMLACIAEFSPLVPESSPIRPNFANFEHGPNLPVLVYVLTFPILTLLANSFLFCYASYKMCSIQRSTKLASASSTTNANKARKRYFLYLRLYLLMDAPWITSALAAAFSDLWLLKFFRIIQPILMLLSILPPQTTKLICGCGCFRRRTRSRDLDRDRDSQLPKPMATIKTLDVL